MSTNLEHDDLESCHSQKTCSTATSPLGPLQTSYLTFPSQSYPSPPSRTVLKGYKFYKADPSLDEAATWACAERTELRMKQEQLYEMIHERAEDYSARQQYKNLSRDQRAQVTQLAEDQRVDYPRMEWSCVYAKESYYANKARNPNRHDFETVSMTIIMTGRPMEPTKYPRTPMGEYVDLRKHCQPHEGDMNHSRSSVAKIGPSGYYRVQAQHSAPKPVRRYLNQGSDSRRVVPPSVLSTQLGSCQLPVYDK
ncbi:uncharacterized protein N7446_012629 [Penicillium canescens]|uniref:Uncharacterized protein n=1 Tax=Penicillium canescens TaxID=5083 RepID=A0AAD6IAG8_PENCN|nr:uncharacterized protein N7446_012629 [Penicillium canescens]KAJ6038819.1 hypothetical protein N7460_007536 [Penicillium canescens]KAJ6045765.1 hypothetical protein N7446_012629 [Penicillium canescens]